MGQYNSAREIFWASGTCLMIRAELYHRLGGLDDLFFAHMEEIDLCWRAKLQGEEVWVVPESEVFHVGGGTLPNNSPHKLYLNYRNNLFMLYKNLPKKSRSSILFRRMVLDGISAAIYLLQGKPHFFRSVVRAHRDYYKLRKGLTITEHKKEANYNGIYQNSIVLQFFLCKKKRLFSNLKIR